MLFYFSLNRNSGRACGRRKSEGLGAGKVGAYWLLSASNMNNINM